MTLPPPSADRSARRPRRGPPACPRRCTNLRRGTGGVALAASAAPIFLPLGVTDVAHAPFPEQRFQGLAAGVFPSGTTHPGALISVGGSRIVLDRLSLHVKQETDHDTKTPCPRLTDPGTLRVGINLGNILRRDGNRPYRRSPRCRAGYGGGDLPSASATLFPTLPSPHRARLAMRWNWTFGTSR